MSNNNENNTTTVDFSKLRDFIKENNEYNKTIKKKKKKIVVFFINIITIVSLIAGGIGIKLLLDYKEDQEETKKLQQELADKKETIISMVEQDIQKEIDEIPVVDPKITELFDSLLKDNNDAVAWLKLNNTDIDTPIVQSDNNEYYLNHNFNKKYNEIGWTFADYRNNFPDLSTNTIIYGHTYRNSTLAFSSLKKVLNKSWYDNEENQIIYLTTTEKELKFKIFSIYTVKNTNDYLKTNMNKEEFNVFIANALERSVKNFNTEVKYGDKILTLSTCYNTSNYRLVVHAKLVEDDYE
ncbi:MAG: class B sortase [bacterium]|nr:class B sortase [bacterium]